MSDEEEYDGYDYEEEDSGYESPESPGFVTGYKEQQFQGRFTDNGEEQFGSEIAGGGLGTLQRKQELIGMNNLEKFQMNLDYEIKTNRDDLSLTATDIKRLKDTAAELHFIQFKNELFYLLGYYVTKIKKKKEIDATVKRLLKKSDNVLIEVVKYARFWESH